MNTSKNAEVSVVVCTYRRADVLRLCLESLVTQTKPSSAFEVIVVDNNSRDQTKSVVDSVCARAGNVRYVLEQRQGLSHARNRGYHEAAAEYVAYIDDDARVPEDWVTKVCSIIREHHPDVFGGCIHPYYLTPKPDWFEDKYEIRVHQEETGWMPKTNRRFLSGSNMIFRKSLLAGYGGFNPALGMTGGKIRYGEETELVERALREDRKVYYALDLIVYHLVPEHKMRLWYHIYSNYKWGKDAGGLWESSYGADAVMEMVGMLDTLLEAANGPLNGAAAKPSARAVETLLLDEYAPTIREIGRRVGFLLRENEPARLRSLLKVSPGDSRIGFKEYLALNLRLLRRTKAVAALIDLIRGRGRQRG